MENPLKRIKFNIKLPSISFNYRQRMLVVFSASLISTVLVVSGGISAIEGTQNFFDVYYLAKHPIIEGNSEYKAYSLKFSLPITFEPRIKEDLTPVYAQVVQIETKNEENIAQYICSKFPKEECAVALSIVMAESHMNPEAVNKANKDGTMDAGLFQVNERNWKIDGCELKTLFDGKKNTDCAYKIWDRRDGVEGDGKGSWEAWATYNSGSYKNYYSLVDMVLKSRDTNIALGR